MMEVDNITSIRELDSEIELQLKEQNFWKQQNKILQYKVVLIRVNKYIMFYK